VRGGGALAPAAEAVPGRFLLDGARGVDLREAAFRLAVERGWVLLELAEEKVSLEDIFVRLTTREPDAEEEVASAAPAASSPATDGPVDGDAAGGAAERGADA
jgi:ABC-2 type transport system ATP-binding protein